MSPRLQLLRLLAVVASSGALPTAAHAADAPVATPAPVAESDRAVVASAHPLATRAGIAMLERGGSAVDAAVAIGFALSAVEPWSSGIGGGGFMLVHRGGETTTWDFREVAPAAATRDMYLVDGKVVRGESTWSARAAAIPGHVRGLVAVHRAYGKLKLEVVMEPAIRYARDGFAVSPRMHGAMGQMAAHLNPAARRIFLDPGGEPLAVGAMLVQPDLARTLEAIAQTGGEAFYRGGVAREMVRAVRAEGGIWTLDDLARYQVKQRAAVAGDYRGYRVVSMGPPSSGGVLLVQMLGVLEGFAPAPAAGVEQLHRLTETMKRAFAMRAVGLGDPDFHDVPFDTFFGRSTIKRLAAEVKKAKRATPAEALSRLQVDPSQRTHTSHFAVLLADGDAVSCTQTINLRFGSGRVAGSTGVVLNNEMDDFSAHPGAPNAFGLVGVEANAIAPFKRPLSSMTPTIVIRDGRAVGAFGSPGGSRIITTTLQSVLNVIDHQQDVGRALAAPRVHHQWYPDTLWHEPGALAPEVARALVERGHQLQPVVSMGNAMAVWRRADGKLTAAADPRGEGTAAGL